MLHKIIDIFSGYKTYIAAAAIIILSVVLLYTHPVITTVYFLLFGFSIACLRHALEKLEELIKKLKG